MKRMCVCAELYKCCMGAERDGRGALGFWAETHYIQPRLRSAFMSDIVTICQLFCLSKQEFNCHKCWKRVDACHELVVYC